MILSIARYIYYFETCLFSLESIFWYWYSKKRTKQVRFAHFRVENAVLISIGYLQNHNVRRTGKLKRFTSIPYVQGVCEPISRILTQVGIGVALKPHHTLSSLFRKPKDAINFEQKRGLVYQISCRDCNAEYVGETERSARTRKREHVDAVKTFNTKKSTLSQHVMDFDHRIDWDNVKILKSESHAYRHRIAESFLISQKARSFIVINRNDGANFPTVYSVFIANE